MNAKNMVILFLFAVLIFSCKQEDTSGNTAGESVMIFAKGDQIANDNFTGAAFLNSLAEADSTNPTAVGSVTFEPSARTNWHSHPAGQIILVLGGEGYYQEAGSPKRIIHQGDVVKCPPNVPHWHGASIDKAFVQVAITGRQNGQTKWMGPVRQEEYTK